MERKRVWRWISLACGLFVVFILAGCFGGGGDDNDGGNDSGGGAINTAPAPTAPPIETVEDTPGTSQISVNDPDAGQTHTFTIVTPPLGGMATVDAAGLVTYRPDAGFTGMDSLGVQVMDSGDPPSFGTVTIDVTVASVEMPVTPSDLANRAFTFPDARSFDDGLTDEAATVTFGEFTGDVGSFIIVTQDGSAGGPFTIYPFPDVSNCTFTVEFSSFPIGDGPQIGEAIGMGPCTIDPRDGHLTLVNFDTSAVSVSEPPEAPAPPPGSVFLGTWTGTWESAIPPELGGGSGDITVVIESEMKSFPGSSCLELTGTLTMTGPGKDNITNISVEDPLCADSDAGFSLSGTPSGELSSCQVQVGTTDFFSPTHMAGLFQIGGVCPNTERDSGTFELFRQQ